MTPALQRLEPGDPRAKAIEAMARGVRQRWLDEQRLDLEPAWEHLHDESKDSYLADARAALAALEEEGLVLTDTREVERLREALRQIAGDDPPYPDWSFAGRCQDRERAMQNIAAEALSSVPVEEEGPWWSRERAASKAARAAVEEESNDA